ncbi:MAG: BamA/TamA family outer membrane protein [Nitrospirales bacterium]|nr:ShlB/FhaC/HecB family hemolysin secretion/activation protein [Nitrospira sp.]MDR4501359.1 BamA/TamA family outer membrane protein [Nitrospirales bacterium]
MNTRHFATCLLIGIILLSCTIGHWGILTSLAQTIPDAGVLQQQQRQSEMEREQSFPEEVPPDAPPAPQQAPQSAVTILVKSFRFSGNTQISDGRLQTVVAPYVNKHLDLAALRKATADIAEYYRQAGWIVRAYLPKQDITDGTVTINIQEATFGGAAISGEPPTHVAAHDITDLIDTQLTPQQLLNTKALDRGLLLADDLPGVAVAGALQAGAREGETTVQVTAADDPLLHGQLGVNNGGNRGTGMAQGYATAYLNSPLKLGDQLIASTIISPGSEYGRLRYTVPIGHDGWRIGASASLLSYRLIAPEFSALRGKGHASTVGLEAFYPLIRARTYNLQMLMNYDYRQFENRALGTRQSDYHINEGTFGLAGNWFETLTGLHGSNFGSLTWVLGTLDQGRHQASENSNREGFFTKFRLSLSRQQELLPWLSLRGIFSGQKAFETLDSAEKYYMGGPSSVRAYPVNEASGSSGLTTNLELQAQLPYGLTLTGFYDVGRVYNKRNVGKDYTLKGGGLSVAWVSWFGLSLDATWSHRLGDNPNPTATGKDQDGSHILNRFWLSAVYAF